MERLIYIQNVYILIPFFERVRCDAEKLKLYEKIKDELMIIGQEVEKTCLPDFILSRGEYVYAKLFSFFSGIRFVDSKNLIGFYDDGSLNLGYSEYKIREEFSKGKFITGGFYGSYENGDIKTFSRGGGDLSGSIMARAMNADEYINFTDVDGVYSLSPKICESKIIKEISFDEVRKLGEFGASANLLTLEFWQTIYIAVVIVAIVLCEVDDSQSFRTFVFCPKSGTLAVAGA